MANCEMCGKHFFFKMNMVDFGDHYYCPECALVVRNRFREEEKKAEEKRKQERDRQRVRERRSQYRQRVCDRVNQFKSSGQDAHGTIWEKKEWSDLLLHLDDRDFVVFDFETTGLNVGENEIVEIGAIKVCKGQIIDEFNQLVHPVYGLNAEAMAVNHITGSMVAGQPEMDTVYPRLKQFFGELPLVAHNASFDAQFLLLEEMIWEDPPYRNLQFIDTLKIAKAVWKNNEVTNYKLGTLESYVGYTDNDTHRALSDVKGTYAVLKAAAKAFQDSETEKMLQKKLKTDIRAYLRKNTPCKLSEFEEAFKEYPYDWVADIMKGIMKEGKLEKIRSGNEYYWEYRTKTTADFGL